MVNKIKNYITYLHNRGIVKRQLRKGVNYIATLLPAVNGVLEEVLKDKERFMEILSYMATLTPEEIQKVLVHSMVESNSEIQNVDNKGE